MNYSNIKYFSTVNGIGVRTALFVSGCDQHCKGCFNKIAWDYNFGNKYTQEVEERILDSLDKPYISGLSLLGGEPLAQQNIDGIQGLIRHCRERYGDSKDIWLWSGFYVSDMNEKQLETVKMCDYVVDGPFIEPEKHEHYKFKGSKNQHIWKIVDGEFTEVEL